jgi:hypothetical protein
MDLAIMNSYYCKCSICFENDSEIEFINCGDQFCLDCLERYVYYWIREGSWGLLPVELTCPVCGVEMLEDDWMPYISDEAIQMWNKFQDKREDFIKNFKLTRPCPQCDHPQLVIGENQGNFGGLQEQSDRLGRYLDALLISSPLEGWRCIFGLEDAVEQAISKSDFSFEATDGESDYYDEEEDEDEGKKSFNDFLDLIEKLQEANYFVIVNAELIRLLMEFGREFLKELSGKNGYNSVAMQLNFQGRFHYSRCDACGVDFCLSCLVVDWFEHEHLRGIRQDGTKQCPRCFSSIEKESDGGCNEMRCGYCGMKFCWECGRKWSQSCGVYKCKTGDNEDLIISEPRSLKSFEEVEPEIGVPNVKTIIKRNHQD